MPPSTEERLAILETEHKQLVSEIKAIRSDVQEIKKAVTSWRGVVLGVVLTVSFIWTGFIGLWNVAKHKIGM